MAEAHVTNKFTEFKGVEKAVLVSPLATVLVLTLANLPKQDRNAFLGAQISPSSFKGDFKNRRNL